MSRLFLTLPTILLIMSVAHFDAVAQADGEPSPQTQTLKAQAPEGQADSLISDTARIMQAWRAIEDDPAVGSSIPDFSIQLLDNPSRKLTTRSMRGRNYLLVLWSPRDRASMSFMVSLAESLEPWAKSGLSVLAAAVHSNSADIATQKAALPSWWKLSVLSKNHGKKMLEDFDVWKLPVAILVNQHGLVTASGQKLQSPWLDVTLETLLR